MNSLTAISKKATDVYFQDYILCSFMPISLHRRCSDVVTKQLYKRCSRTGRSASNNLDSSILWVLVFCFVISYSLWHSKWM